MTWQCSCSGRLTGWISNYPNEGQFIELASYEGRMLAIARALGVPLADLDVPENAVHPDDKSEPLQDRPDQDQAEIGQQTGS